MENVDKSAGASPVMVINLGEAEAGPAYPKITKDNRGWLKWGGDNLYPQRLLEACLLYTSDAADERYAV